MSQSYQHPVPDRIEVDEIVVGGSPSKNQDDDTDALPGLELLIARLSRIAGDQMRSRQYKRRSNLAGSGFRRHQRRGAVS